MKLKYYLRGVGIGIVFATLVLTVAFASYSRQLKKDLQTQYAASYQEDSQSEEKENSQDSEKADEAIDTESQTAETENLTDTQALLPQGETTSEDYAVITIEKGEVCRQLSEDLQEAGLVTDSEEFRKYMGEKNSDSNLQAGIYYIPVGADYDQIIEVLGDGPTE